LGKKSRSIDLNVDRQGEGGTLAVNVVNNTTIIPFWQGFSGKLPKTHKITFANMVNSLYD
jgi:hypothetical protein